MPSESNVTNRLPRALVWLIGAAAASVIVLCLAGTYTLLVLPGMLTHSASSHAPAPASATMSGAAPDVTNMPPLPATASVPAPVPSIATSPTPVRSKPVSRTPVPRHAQHVVSHHRKPTVRTVAPTVKRTAPKAPNALWSPAYIDDDGYWHPGYWTTPDGSEVQP
ncbi:hypothetical protein [Paraburkholderia megapolitana]|uniref:hypothetical protein n=1 Tax=Paraburkholderia megapolitana TaxID=420953 RepID=UPI001160C3E5|nr:hypothetical protein [Paraburkholderia megapolitana]QDQ82914.1 hypothetical protein FNZ07_16885 [Paraburkholderia megapolitana]